MLPGPRRARLLALLPLLGAPQLDGPPPAAGGPDRDALLGPPLVVDGEAIPRAALQRHLIYAVGGHVLERARLRWMVEAELVQRAHRHALRSEPYDPTFARTFDELARGYAVGPEELDEELAYQRSLLRWLSPELDVDAAIRRVHGTVGELREHVRAWLLFDKVFLPPDPDDWPAVTVEAFLADPEGGELLLEDARESYAERRRLAAEHGGAVPRDDDVLWQIYRDIVLRSLSSWLDVRTAQDGLQLPLVATVDFDADGLPEEQLAVDDLWPEVRGLVGLEDVRVARRWLATVAATRARLLDGGAGPERELRAAARRERERRADEPGGPAAHGFPSDEAAFEHAWLREGFRRRAARELLALARGEVAPGLGPALERARAIGGRARAASEILLVAAWDARAAAWKEDGWERARAGAAEIAGRLEAGRALQRLQLRRHKEPSVDPEQQWARELEQHGELRDEPRERRAPPRRALNGGRLGPQGYEDLAALLEESAYRRFALGETIADLVFFRLPPCAVAGPFRGPHGYYLVRVLERGDARREVHASAAAEAVLDEAFLDFARGSLEQAEVEGLDG